MSVAQVGRWWHRVTLVVAVGGLVLQLGVILAGQTILDDSVVAAPMPEQVRRFFSYFTIQSNLLVAVSMALLLAGRSETRLYRVVRLASLVGITVTGIVAAVALPPNPNYTVLNLLCDRLLHIAVPVLTVIGWLVFGPRGRLGRSDILPALAWPVLWLVATLALAPLIHWYPYPFLNVGTLGAFRVLINCLVIAVLFIALSTLAVWADRRLPGRGRAGEPAAGAGPGALR